MWYIRLMTNVGKRIDAEIRRQHLSKVEVAKRADISVDGLRRITRGEVNPRRDTIERVASALQIDVVLKGGVKCSKNTHLGDILPRLEEIASPLRGKG